MVKLAQRDEWLADTGVSGPSSRLREGLENISGGKYNVKQYNDTGFWHFSNVILKKYENQFVTITTALNISTIHIMFYTQNQEIVINTLSTFSISK